MKKTILIALMVLTLLTLTMATTDRMGVEDRPGMQHMVLVEKGEDSYCINRYEVTFGDYCKVSK